MANKNSSSRPSVNANSFGGATYKYPSTIGKKVAAGQHYMMITSYESRNSMNHAEGVKSSIALYIPAGGLSSTISQTYEEIEGGALFAQSGNVAIDSYNDGNIGKAAIMSAGGIAVSRVVNKLKRNVIASLGGGFAQAGLGVAVNNHLSVGYKGPSGFRDHSFAFKFFPKNTDDSENVREIIADFKNGSSPSLSSPSTFAGTTASGFFKSPRHWVIQFISGGTENKYLHTIGTSVITTMQTNYDPLNMVSFHNDGTPVQIDLNLTFKEIELVTSEDEVTQGTDNIVDNLKQSVPEDNHHKEMGY